MQATIPRIMLAAAHSGSGKTTVTCALLKAFLKKNLNTAAFKCGPDYIDPMFHTEIVGAPSRNLDLFMVGAQRCKYLLAHNARTADIAVLEGVMGYYDGLGVGTVASSYELAVCTQTPVILVVNAKGAAMSVAAIIKGFKDFRADSNIQGVIINNVSTMVYDFYKEVWERESGVKMCGCIPPLTAEQTFGSRHLGLITAAEIENLQEIAENIGALALQHLDMTLLLDIAQQAPSLEYEPVAIPQIANIRLAIAQDKAFCFYYRDSLELLESLGAELVYFSPMHDVQLPDCDGLYLGGGYPELYLEELSANHSMRQEIKTAVAGGMPCIAECGGFMYLTERIEEMPMVGVINGKSYMTKKLNRFGYTTINLQQDSLLGRQGDQINAHEFHYSDSDCNGCSCIANKPQSNRKWQCVNATETLWAGYPHIHLWGNIDFAENFVRKCQLYAQNRGELCRD